MIRSILALLRSGRVTVCYCHIPEWGLCDWSEREITIRARLSRKNKVRTLIHECIHYLHPSFGEDTVLLIERDIFNGLSQADFSAVVEYGGVP